MNHLLRHPAVSCGAALLALLAAEALERFGAGMVPGVAPLQTVIRTVQNRDLNKEAREELTGGYYEGLLNEGSRVSSMNALITGSRELDWTGTSRPGRRHRQDFLYYDYLPHLDQPDYDDEELRLVTNSHGLADREYSLEKPPATRRVAILGDSLTRGQGAPFGASFEALLEARLNERHTTADIQQFELLNFSVSGYRITQTLEVALEKAPRFQPDAYVVALSDLSVFRKWGHHLGQLIYDGIDLKYPYLKEMSQQAQLSPRDPFGTLDAKLSRHRLPTIRWVLSMIKQQASRDGADLVVVLVPTVTDPKALAEDFMGVPEILSSLEIPVIDLLGTFEEIDDLNPYRVSPSNRHPNERGHALLFERLYEHSRTHPLVFARITGALSRAGS
jgi:lysophospholipase L1-like esterase